MSKQTIKCPNCNFEIPLADVLTHDLKHELRGEMQKEVIAKEKALKEKEQKLLESQKNIDSQVAEKLKNEKMEMWQRAQKAAKEEQEVAIKNMQTDLEEKNKKLTEMREQELEILKQKREIEEQQKNMELELNKKLEKEKEDIIAKAQREIAEKQATEMKDMQKALEEKESKMREMQTQELELRKQKREVEEKQKNMELELARKMDAEREKIAMEAKKQAAEETHLKVLEKDKQMEQMRRTIEDLKRKSEQGSMQVQGDTQEENVKELLQRAFPLDIIEDVPTGIRGADLIQTVHSGFGQKTGIILWESKNTKAWSNDWIKKLKDDQGLAKADVCILITRTLPDDIENFGIKDGVWVVSFPFALPLVNTLRLHLNEVDKVKQSHVGKNEKMEYLYNYLAGNEFKNRIENIVNAFGSMKEELDKEKRAMERIWNRRAKEIERVITNTSGMYGDLQGIIGASLPTIQSLELPEGE